MEIKKDVSNLLPYDRNEYRNFLCSDLKSSVEWYGVSFQLHGGVKEIQLSEYVKSYENFFNNVILKLDNDSFWIVNHDDKDLKWLPNDDGNLIHLRTAFKQKDVPNTFKGAVIFKTEELLQLSTDLISYPVAVYFKKKSLYKNLDISHGELPFIMKISGHMNIDLLSTNKDLLREITNQNKSSIFCVKEYRSTSL